MATQGTIYSRTVERAAQRPPGAIIVNRPAVTEGVLKRAIKVFEARGLPVGGLRLYPDGSILVVAGEVGDAPHRAPADDLDAELDAWKRENGYG